MSCPSVDRLYDDLDGALTGAEKESVERHLQSCESCRRARAVRGRIAGAAADLPPFEVPPDFAAGVMAGIAALPVPAAKKLHPGLVWTAAAAAAAGAGIGLGMILAGAGSAAWLSRNRSRVRSPAPQRRRLLAKGGKLPLLGRKNHPRSLPRSSRIPAIDGRNPRAGRPGRSHRRNSGHLDFRRRIPAPPTPRFGENA